MLLLHLIKNAIVGLRANKTRSALTILGIVIGIAAIILIVSIGQAAEKLILNEIGGLGAETVVVRPGKEPTGPSDIVDTLFADSLKNRDVDALRNKANIPTIVKVIPAVFLAGSVSYKGETYRPQIFGFSAELLIDMFNIYPAEGVYFGEAEIRQKEHVAVIGSKVRTELFGEENPIGKTIRIKDQNFRVIGLMPSKGQIVFFNVDEMVLIPDSTAQTYLLGIDYYNEILVKAESPDAVARTVKDIKRTLRDLHGITDPDKDDFYVATQEGIIDQVKIILDVLTALLSSVVAISLVVGGIGVMNIMLVSVTERTREIGLRKAVGATEKNILGQFLIESVLLTGIGGIVGVLFGFVLSLLAALILTKALSLSWVFSFPFSAAFLGIVVSAGVGLVFGIYPARKAAKKNPIDALRWE